MILFTMLVLLTIVVLIGPAVQAADDDVIPTCRAVNAEVDGALRSSDYLMHIQSGAYWMEDFSLQLKPIVFGLALPFKVLMDATNGMVRPLDSLTRNSTATGCSSPMKTVQVLLRYDNLQVTYDATSQFLFHEVPGKLVINLDPVYCDVLIVEGDGDCRLGAFSAELTGLNFDFIPNSSSWTSSLVAKILSRSLQALNSTPISSLTVNKLQANVNTLFTRAWCELSLF